MNLDYARSINKKHRLTYPDWVFICVALNTVLVKRNFLTVYFCDFLLFFFAIMFKKVNGQEYLLLSRGVTSRYSYLSENKKNIYHNSVKKETMKM